MKLYWDFFGPDAQTTAAHFVKHLTQFLENNGQSSLERGTESAGDGHHAAYCCVPDSLVEPMKRALRPNRLIPDVTANDTAASPGNVT